jgi:hypothetical protein
MFLDRSIAWKNFEHQNLPGAREVQLCGGHVVAGDGVDGGAKVVLA